MNVGIVTPRYPPTVAGGGEISSALLAENLRRNDRVSNVRVYSFDGSGSETRNGVSVSRLRELSPTVTEWQNIRAYPMLKDRLADHDIVHAYNMELNPVVGVVGSKLSLPTVATLNSYHFLPSSVSNTTPSLVEALYETFGHPTTGRLLLNCSNRIDRFIAISEAVKDIYSDHGTPADRIEVVPNMYDPSFSPPEDEPTDVTQLLYVGEISERKGVDVLVRAVAALPPSFRLRIVGDGPILDECQHLADRLGVADQVEFTGRVDYEAIPAQYASADIFVHPGVWPEPFGRTVIEAMQSGLPVVCTDTGGPADLVRNPAFRCQPGDPNALAEAIRHIELDSSDVGPRNREYVSEQLSPASVTEQIIDVYEDVLESRITDS